MQENHKSFIKRHIRALIDQGREPEIAIQQSYLILDSEQQTKTALSIFEESGSLSTVLHKTKVVQLESSLLDALAEKENADGDDHDFDSFILVNLLETDQTIDEIFSLLKIKLRTGLSYAFLLSTVATLIFTLISSKVLPQFEEMFAEFGAELPTFTKLAIMWQQSLVSPGVIGLVFTFCIGALILSLRKLSSDLSNRSVIRRLPFIRNISNYTICIRWLSQLKALSSLGFKLKNCEQKLSSQPQAFKKHMPHTMGELSVAEKIENLPAEFDYQIHQLNQQAESLVIKTTRSLLAVVMFFVMGYVAFTIYASYLPIFQLGAIV